MHSQFACIDDDITVTVAQWCENYWCMELGRAVPGRYARLTDSDVLGKPNNKLPYNGFSVDLVSRHHTSQKINEVVENQPS